MKTKLRSFLIMFVLLLVPIVLLETVLYYGAMWANRTTSNIQIKEHVVGQADQLIREIQSVVSDVMFLSENEEIMAFLDSGSASQRETLANEYLAFSYHKAVYDQIREHMGAQDAALADVLKECVDHFEYKTISQLIQRKQEGLQ